MKQHTHHPRARSRHANPRGGPSVRGGALLLALLGMLGIGTSPSMADGCSDCPTPSAESIIAAEGIKLETRTGPFGLPSTDQLHTDQGECHAQGEAFPDIDIKESYLVLSGAGEVWNCPDSKSSSQVTAEIAREHKTDWSLTASVELSMKTPVAEYKARFSASQGGSDGIREVTRLSTTIQAQNCRRVPWLAYLRVGTYELRADFAISQRWAWWTKNPATGSEVHASGDHMVSCGSTEVVFERKAPMAWHVRLAVRNCCGKAGPYRDLGFWPPLPPGLGNPKWPPEFGLPKPPLPQDSSTPTDEPTPPAGEPNAPQDQEGDMPRLGEPLDDPLAPPPHVLPPDAPGGDDGPNGDDAPDANDPSAGGDD